MAGAAAEAEGSDKVDTEVQAEGCFFKNVFSFSPQQECNFLVPFRACSVSFHPFEIQMSPVFFFSKRVVTLSV
jgi:hypothetical protein